MYKIKKRFVSILLAMAMVITLFVVMPMTALAAPVEYAGDAVALYHAINNVDSNGVITLTANISTFSSIIYVYDKDFTINLNGFTLDINYPGIDSPIEVVDNHKLTIKGPGILNVTAHFTSAIWIKKGKLINDGATINAIANSGDHRVCGVRAEEGSEATVSNVTAANIGIWANGANSSVTVTGSISATGTCVWVLDGGKATVGSVTVTGINGNGAYVAGVGCSVTVKGNISATARDSTGVYVSGTSSSVTVTGSVSATWVGVNVDSGGTATVGSVTASGTKGYGVIVENTGSSVTVTGSVNATYRGVYAYNGGKAITGSVVSGVIGAAAATGGNITIDGTITVPSNGYYLYIESTSKTSSDFKTPTTKAGYRTYTDGTSTVWVKEITVPSAPRNLTATPGNGSVTLNWTIPSSNGGSVILRYLVTRDNGANWVTASSNTSHTFNGLTNGTSYTFWVLAVNSVGYSTAVSVSAKPGGNQTWTLPSSINRFNDVPNNNWQNAAVSWADSNGITTGSPAGSSTFKPNDTITRAEFVTFLHRIYGSPSATRAPFTDMPGNPAFQNAISWAYKEGITTGSPAGSSTFMPNANITREQIAAMLYRYVGGGNPAPDSLGSYTDQSSISTWLGAREAVNWAVYHKIMGQNVTTLNPRGNATRAEAVTMLYRVVERFNISAP